MKIKCVLLLKAILNKLISKCIHFEGFNQLTCIKSNKELFALYLASWRQFSELVSKTSLYNVVLILRFLDVFHTLNHQCCKNKKTANPDHVQPQRSSILVIILIFAECVIESKQKH